MRRRCTYDRAIRREFGLEDKLVVLVRSARAGRHFHPPHPPTRARLERGFQRLPGINPSNVLSLATEASFRMRPGTFVPFHSGAAAPNPCGVGPIEGRPPPDRLTPDRLLWTDGPRRSSSAVPKAATGRASTSRCRSGLRRGSRFWKPSQ